MISSIGTDIIKISRIEKIIKKYSDNFLDHIFTKNEQVEALGSSSEIIYYASRWAVKESVSKALGTGIGANCSWKDIIVVHDNLGKPSVELFGDALNTAQKLNIKKIHISISHEKEFAIAFAIAEKA